jgi:tetratricopeptide (TPR) repeat protein
MSRPVRLITSVLRSLAVASMSVGATQSFTAVALPAQSASHADHQPAGAPRRNDGPVPLYHNLGTHAWPVSATNDGQQYFNQGLRLLWAFNLAESMRSFREGERVDPSCAMCAWGVAMAAGPNLNVPMSPSAADTAAAAIARAERQAAAVSPKERVLIDALSQRYASREPVDRARLDSAYARAMAKAVEDFPDDVEIKALYADALMNLSPWNYWKADGSPRPDTPAILEQLERAIAVNTNHPGACHLYIHAVEATQPARALPCAERLASLMPGAGHLVHMPGHIYIRVGRYADAVEANKHAVHADQTLFEGPAVQKRGPYASGLYPHNHHFLTFAATMMGNSRLAIDNAYKAAAAVDPAVAAELSWIDGITPIVYSTLAAFARWDAILDAPLPAAGQRLTTGIAYYARGLAFANKRRWAEARSALDSVSRIASAHPANENRIALEIAEHLLASQLAYGRGFYNEALREARAAVQLEDQLPYTEPPVWFFPARHALGRVYLKVGRARDAERVYRQDLARFPENGWSLFGLAESLGRQGRHGEASDVRRRFEAAWAGADIRLTKAPR